MNTVAARSRPEGRTGVKLARAAAGLVLLLFLFGLVFRATLYSRLYLAPGDPYGLADVIEYFLGWALLAALALSLLLALTLAIRGPRHNRAAAAWLAIVSLAVVALLNPLHNFAAHLSIR